MSRFDKSSDIFVVVGTKGEYSERSAWTVRAFFKEDEAKQFIIDQEKRDIIEFVINEKKNEILYELSRVWKEKNPYPVYNHPEKPKLDHSNPDKKLAQRLHIENLSEWTTICNPLRAQYHEEIQAWNIMKAAEVLKFEAQALQQVTEMTIVVTPKDAERFEKTRYYIEDISIYVSRH
jgi:vacuolar-type H+-ATPase subunit I/STV1